MTDSPYGVTPGGAWPPPASPQGPPPAWPPAAPKQSPVPIAISLVVAITAIAVAVGAWFKPSPEPRVPAVETPQFSNQQVADAKGAVCGAYQKSKKAITAAATQSSSDPTVSFVIAVNTRLATQFSSRYMTAILANNPAAPTDVSTGVDSIASAWDEMVLTQLGGATGDDPSLQPLFAKIDSADAEIEQACK
jgi:hypothetical protein